MPIKNVAAIQHKCTHAPAQVAGRDDAIAFSNAYAPEHLIVNVEGAEEWLPALDNAGSVFLGRWEPTFVCENTFPSHPSPLFFLIFN